MNRPLSPHDDITGSTPYVGMAREMASPKYKPIDPLQLHNEYCKISTLAICVDDGEFLCHTAISALGIPSNFTAGSGIQSMLLLLWSSIKAVHIKPPFPPWGWLGTPYCLLGLQFGNGPWDYYCLHHIAWISFPPTQLSADEPKPATKCSNCWHRECQCCQEEKRSVAAIAATATHL